MPSNPLERELPSENDLELGVTGTGTRTGTGTATEQGPVSPSSRDESRHGPLQRQDSVAASSYTSIGSSSSSSSSSSSTIVDDDEDEGGNPVVALIGSVANLCSATLGAGILALPFAFYQAGIICGVLLLVTSALATSFSIGLLAETCDRYNLSTYEKIVERGLGRTARKIVEVSILVFCCGTAVGYVIAVGDIIQRVVPYPTPSQKRVATSAVWCVAMLPLSCLRKMKSLECASSVGILSIGTLLAAAVVHLLRGDGDGDGNSDSNSDSDLYGYYDADAVESTSVASLLGPAGGSWMSVLRACPIFFYAFSCQVNVAQIFDELPQRALARAVAADGSRTSGSSSGGGSEKPKLAAMRRVTSAGVWVCGLLYAGVSLVTLVDFGSSVQPNILSNYDLSGGSGSGGGGGAQPLLHVAFLGMALAVVMAFPLNVFPARVSLIQMWEERQKENYSHSHSPPTEPGDVRQPLLSVENRRQNRNGNGNGNRAVGGLDYNSDGETDAAATATATGTSCSITTASAPAPEEALPLHERHGHDDTTAGGDDDDDDDDGEFRFARHALVTLLLAGMALGLALVVPNISLVFGLLGGTTSSLLGFVVPGLLGLQQDRNRIGAWILVICGSIVGVLTTGVTIYSVFRHS